MTIVAPTWPATGPGIGPGQSREARLRPEFGHLYPGLRADEWDAAATVADRVLAGCLIRSTPSVIRGRVLPGTHFEFRGGESMSGERGARFRSGM